ncbi:hypothetical protein HAHE_15290 [Haloferula helveola]|uniref:Transcriptional regulator n=1 Tax=Haloferula helveola TaxID=490095 RepID=A0ABN6H1Z0_9BACT|nr:hypothetical protein HAHE_15290 [Haloferula helveola]
MDHETRIQIGSGQESVVAKLRDLPELRREYSWMEDYILCRVLDSGEEMTVGYLLELLESGGETGEEDSPKRQAAMLRVLLENQAKQDQVIAEMSSKIGCLYWYMIVSIVIAVIAFLLSL